MSEQLYRTIVGQQLEPLFKRDEVPVVYRQTLKAPLTPKVQGSDSSEPREADSSPITENS